MIHFSVSTQAEFIKMAPVMAELRRRDIKFRYVDPGQHVQATAMLRKSFDIPDPDVCLWTGKDVASLFSAFLWLCKMFWLCFFSRKYLREKVFPDGGICLIHGDTASTLIGLKMAKAAGLKIAHVEAGLRSFNIWHPFPEEMVRIYCMKRADILFAPSKKAEENLIKMKVKGEIINAGGNTVVDALRLVENIEPTVEIPTEDYALAACHRFETITRKKRLEKVIELFNKTAEKIKVVFVVHKPTKKYLAKFKLMEKISEKISVLDMQEYVNFAALMRNAKMVLADGGSIQEECAYLNKPCLVLRNTTERLDGLGGNAMLWGFDGEMADSFYEMAKGERQGNAADWPTPAKNIIDKIIKYGEV